MKHPTDDRLLAYIRQQQHYLWPQGIQEHLALCPVCSMRCAELENVGKTLESWASTYAVDPAYSTVTNRVLQKLYESEVSFSQRMLQGLTQVRTRLPVAALLVILCIVTLTGLAAHLVTSVASSVVPVQKHTVHTHVATTIPRQPTPIPTVNKGGTTVKATPIPIAIAIGKPSIVTADPCTTAFDSAKHHIFVCGNSFTPGSTVTIYYLLSGGKSKQHTMQVSADGTFTDMLVVSNCKYVPIAIYVQSTTNPPQTAQILKPIEFGQCQVSGKRDK